MNKDDFKKNIEKLQQSFAAEKKKYEESKGYGADTEVKDDPMYNMMRYMDESLSYLYKRIYAVEDGMYEYQAKHGKNHLPPLTPTAMAKMLKSCGMEEDYEIIKPTINMSRASKDAKGNISIEF